MGTSKGLSNNCILLLSVGFYFLVVGTLTVVSVSVEDDLRMTEDQYQNLQQVIIKLIKMTHDVFVFHVHLDNSLNSNNIDSQQFKEMVMPRMKNEPDYMKTDFYLMRWLRAKNFHLQQADSLLMEVSIPYLLSVVYHHMHSVF